MGASRVRYFMYLITPEPEPFWPCIGFSTGKLEISVFEFMNIHF
jgi:hypothetical protein